MMFRFWKIFDALINDVDGSKIHDNSISNEKIISIDGHKLIDRSVPHTKLIEGEGSGLNADLLDGIHGSQVVRNDVASKIKVDGNWFPLVIAGTPDPNGSDSIGMSIFPDDDGNKRIEYSSKRNGDFRIYQANEQKNVLEKDGSDLIFLGNKVWHSGDFSAYVNSSSGYIEGYIQFPNGYRIVVEAHTISTNWVGQATFTFSKYLTQKLYGALLMSASPEYFIAYDSGYPDGRYITVYVRKVSDGSTPDENTSIDVVGLGFGV